MPHDEYEHEDQSSKLALHLTCEIDVSSWDRNHCDQLSFLQLLQITATENCDHKTLSKPPKNAGSTVIHGGTGQYRPNLHEPTESRIW